MKKTVFSIVLVILSVAVLTACGGRQEGLGAGGGQSLREGSTSPYHSDIAQDETYQTILGLNILLYPAPIDDPKFEDYGELHWEIDPTDFVAAMEENFTGEKTEQAVYEPVVDALQDHPFVSQIQELVYDGEPVQVGWIYGLNGSFDALEFNGVTVTLIPANDIVLFLGPEEKLNTDDWTYASGDTEAFFVPDHAIVELYPGTMRSFPVRVIRDTGYLAAVIVPEGVGLEEAAPGQGKDQALVGSDHWVFGFAGNTGGFYEGLTGSNTAIEPADASPRFEDK
jgi:hypothetical protein